MLKRGDYILFGISLILVIVVLGSIGNILFFLKSVLGLALITFMLYWKLLPYKNQLYPKHIKIIDGIEKVLTPITTILAKIPKYQFGQHLSMDMGLFIICSILVIALIIL